MADGIRTVAAHVASDAVHDLAEGPLWDAGGNRLLWVDIPNGRIVEGRLAGDRVVVTAEHRVEGPVGVVVPTADGGLLAAGRRGLLTIAPDGTVRHGPPLLADDVDSRFNDGACDPAGRFVVGSMALDDREGEESLHQVAGDGTARVLDGGLTLSNGLGWSPDGTTMYHVDSAASTVWQRPYDVGTGDVGPREVLLDLGDATPDGLCVDRDGNLWIAIWGAGQVRCIDPSGSHLATVEVPAPHTSCPAFVGPALDRLLITTAREDLSPTQLADHPDSGRLFLADVGVSGLPAPSWAGGCDQLT